MPPNDMRTNVLRRNKSPIDAIQPGTKKEIISLGKNFCEAQLQRFAKKKQEAGLKEARNVIDETL